jgi:hypothetical protein
MKKTFLIIITIAALIQPSCKKENVITPTQADQITAQLQKIISENNIKRIIAWDDKSGFPTNISTTLGTNWSFSNGFITIFGYGGSPDSYGKNLFYLDKYEISNILLANGTSSSALILHFRS